MAGRTQFRARYVCRNPGKYIGNPGNIIARSRWEINVMRFFDLSAGVKKWCSEEFFIPYISPKDGKVHKYFPDFYVEYIDKGGNVVKEIVEVKPLHESEEKFAKTDQARAALIINKAKWAAAGEFAKKQGMSFRVITELSIFKSPPKNKPPKKIKPKIVAKKPTRPR